MKNKTILIICLILSAVLMSCAKNVPGRKDAEANIVTDGPVITDDPVIADITPVTDAPPITEAPPVTDAPSLTDALPVTDVPVITDPPINDADAAESPDLYDIFEKYYAENEDLINAHKEQYRSELRKKYKDVPVQRLELLATIEPDEHNTVEIYESAIYGRPATYSFKDDTEGFVFTGIDKTKDLYKYDIVSRLITDGKPIESVSHLDGDLIDWSKPASIIHSVSWTSEYGSDIDAVSQMTGLVCAKDEAVINTVQTLRMVDEPDYYYSVNIRALYLDNSETPLLTNDHISYMSNDGDILHDHYRTCYGDEFVLSLDRDEDAGTLTTVREGSGDPDGRNVQWKLMEMPSGRQIVKIYCEDFGEEYWEGTYSCDYYFYDNGRLIWFDGWFQL